MTVTEPRGAGQVARFGQAHPLLVDIIVGLSWLAPSLLTLLVGTETPRFGVPDGLLFVGIILLVGVCLVLLRRRRPVLCFAIVFVATLPLVLVDAGLGNLAVAFCAFAIAVYDSPRRAWLAGALSAAVTVVTAAVAVAFGIPLLGQTTSTSLSSAVIFTITGLLVLLVALLWGQNAGARKRYIDSLLERARHLERERDQQAQLAALAERSRIARDVHDIVSHSLSVIVRLADGARAVFDSEPQRAREAVGQLGSVARSSLTEMRRVMGVLESTPGSATAQSGVGFDDLPHLVEVYRGIGLPVRLSIGGDAPPESGVQMTVFRVIQEALTNSLRHAQSPHRVSVDIETGVDVAVTITSDGAPLVAPAEEHVGRGLVGMRERAALYSGSVVAGPDGAGNWVVSLVLPGVGR